MIRVCILICAVLVSCSTKKNILYIQDVKIDQKYSVNYKKYEVKVDDILKIDIGSETPEIAAIFNPNGISSDNNNGRESLLYSGYQVDLDGYINFPFLGKLYVLDKTIGEIRDNLHESIIEKGILINPSVDVKLLNGHFTVLGEVNSPGRYTYLSNNINVFEAIGMAGDLTINGQRKDVKLIRENNSEKIISSIDLTNSNFMRDEAYQIYSGDIIIVNPNTTRVKDAGIIGNSGTLLSLLSFILSSIIVISN